MDGEIVLSINEYYTEFNQDIFARSGAENDFNEAVFTERMCEFLVENAIIEDFTYVGYKKSSKGIRIDAWEFNADTEVLNLFVSDFRISSDLEVLSQTDINLNFKRLEKFINESTKTTFYQGIEESIPVYGLVEKIYNKSATISRVQLFLLTNAELSSRVGEIHQREVSKYVCNYDIWDISRLYRIESSGKAREDIEIDFTEISPEGLPCLPAFTGSDSYESYLMVMPGNFIAELYDKYGERLLEQNVRTFLQFRGKVNKGLRNTLQNQPEMFFAYNNGLTATAEAVNFSSTLNKLISVKNLQIVNGGQTTASIFIAKKKNKADLSNVFVQLKLSVISPEDVEDIVPKISEYANTQNKVSAADFFSNHPFHLRIEEISRRMWAPSPEGALRETHWFYERARGQYANAQAKLTPAQTKEFLSKNPRNQMFTKTDLSKFINSFDMKPHIVSLGAQKNFASFASDIGKKWESKDSYFNELYFKHSIAKAILFRFLDKKIMQQNWYGGYKANIVTYSLAKFSYMVEKAGFQFDYDKLWKEQKPSPIISRQLLLIAEKINDIIQDTPEGVTNVTEWCKSKTCWSNVEKFELYLDPEILPELINEDEKEELEKNAVKVQHMVDGIYNQSHVVEKGKHYWVQIREWDRNHKILSPKERGILEVACMLPQKLPSEKQSNVLVLIEEKVLKEGFFAL